MRDFIKIILTAVVVILIVFGIAFVVAGCGSDDAEASGDTTYPVLAEEQCYALSHEDTEWLCHYEAFGEKCVVLRQHNGGGVSCRPSDGEDDMTPEGPTSEEAVA